MKISHTINALFLALFFPFFVQAEFIEVRNLLDSGKSDDALIALKRLDGSNSAEYDFLLASIYQQKNDLDNAVKYAANALEKAPEVSENQMLYAETQGMLLATSDGGIFKKLGQVKRVRKAFQAAVKLDSENLRARSGLAQFYLMVPGIAGGSKKKALAQAQAIYQRDKIQAYPLLAQVYQQQKKPKKAREILSAWAKAQPNEWSHVMTTAYFEQHEGNIDKAYTLYRTWIDNQRIDAKRIHAKADNTDTLTALYQIGKLAATTGQYLDEGALALTQYIEKVADGTQPQKEYAHWRLAQIYQKQNTIEKAKLEIEKGLALNPKNKELRKLKEQI